MHTATLVHLSVSHGIRRSDSTLLQYLNTYFDIPTCACGCGKPVSLECKALRLCLFATDCVRKNRFINPKCPEFHLFEGKSVQDTINDLRNMQSKIATISNTDDHKSKIRLINSGTANPSSLSSIAARTGKSLDAIRAERRAISGGSRNGFYGKTHTAETKCKLARARASQSKIVPKPELAVWGMLKAIGRSFEFQVAINQYIADFVVDGNIVVEVFGDYWHGPKMRSSGRASDDVKLAFLQSLGYTVIVIMESDVFTKTESVVDLLRSL